MRILMAVLCALAPAVAHADHSWELSGLFDHAERPGDRREYIGEFDSDLFSLSATRYFRPVEEGSGPLALAAFLDPRTQLSVATGEEQTTTELISTRGPAGQTDQEIMEYSLRGLYLFPESKWYAGGHYARRETEGRTIFSTMSRTANTVTREDVDDYALFAGKYFGKGATRLELSLEQSTSETERSSTDCPRFLPGPCSTSDRHSESTPQDTPRLSVMHVRRFRSATYALLGEYSEIRYRPEPTPDLDTPRTYFVGAELYPVPTIGVRLGYENYDQSGLEEGHPQHRRQLVCPAQRRTRAHAIAQGYGLRLVFSRRAPGHGSSGVARDRAPVSV